MKTTKNESKKFKILIIGTSGVGKTSLLLKYIKNTFCYDYQVTTGVQFYSKTVRINERSQVVLQIWDTMGQQAFRSVVRSLYKGVSAILLVYSIDRKQTLKQLQGWLKQIQESSHKETIFWLVGTKLDLEDIRQVTKNQANAYAKSINAAGMSEVSAKTGQNVKQLFEKVARYLWKKFFNCQAFRDLVDPPFEQINKSQSISLVNYRLTLKQQKENCCST